MERLRTLVPAASLVASPLLVLAYWLTYPAYGELSGKPIIREIDQAPLMTSTSDVFILVGALLAVPMSLALMRVLSGPTPRLALLGGSLSVIGWIAVAVLVMTDVVAVEIAQQGTTADNVELFEDLLTSPTVIGINVAASLHLLGGLLIGIALIRSRLIPRSLAIAAAAASPVHLAANLSGQLWLDSITWVVVAVAYAYVIPAVLGQPQSAGEDATAVGPQEAGLV